MAYAAKIPMKMPLIGLGTGKLMDKEDVEFAVDCALELGYRHFDTAAGYLNEELIGNVLKRWIDSGKIQRKDLFITTKLPLIGMHPEKVEYFMKTSLQKLKVDYVDLYLIHWPVALKFIDGDTFAPRNEGELLVDNETNLEAIWEEMETQVYAGYTKAIGVSNFNIEQLQRILKASRVQPSVLQVEMNIYFQQKELVKFCLAKEIKICAYAPLGSYGRKSYHTNVNIPMVLDDPIVQTIAKKYEKTNAQILLRFLTQKGIAVIPKSSNKQRLRQNSNILDFELDTSDVALLDGLDQGEEARSFFLQENLKNHPEYPF